jgi:predicted nucleic acid-binding protein
VRCPRANRSTSDELISLDTNILVYSVDLDAGPKHETAIEIFRLVTPDNCVLSLQSLSEFFAAVTRKKLMPIDDATAQLDDWQQFFPVVAFAATTFRRAVKAVKRYKLSFWDAMLWATVREAGARILLSEDFQDGQLLDGVRIANPFRVDDVRELLDRA